MVLPKRIMMRAFSSVRDWLLQLPSIGFAETLPAVRLRTLEIELKRARHEPVSMPVFLIRCGPLDLCVGRSAPLMPGPVRQ